MSSSPRPVPKPSNAGQGTPAIAVTKSGFVNLRNGPSTTHLDIGDIRNSSLVTHFAPTLTPDGWVWIEQNGVGGWVSTSVITFQPSTTPIPTPNTTPTPYDGKIGLWHWKDQAVPENSIDELATNIKKAAPNITQIFVKTNDGPDWQGRFDSGGMVINGPADIDKWVQGLAKYNLEFHGWCVLKGKDIVGEANLVSQICTRPGVRSMILDIEPYTGFWEVGKGPIRPLMTEIRKRVGAAFHIALAVDPRPAHFRTVFPEEWFPFVNSVHLQTYWETFRRPYDEVLNEAIKTWGNYGRPIFPILPTSADTTDLNSARTHIEQVLKSRAVSYWRYGVQKTTNWTVMNRVFAGTSPQPQPQPQPQPPAYSDVIIVRPGDTNFRSGSYTGRTEFQSFAGTQGWNVLYKATEPRESKVWAQWSPRISKSGTWEVAVYVPARHATTRQAQYKVHGVRTTELTVTVDQSRQSNVWVTLGTFELDASNPKAGEVFLTDVTGETGLEIAFDAVRWQRVATPGSGGTPGGGVVGGVFVADGFDSPVGTVDERKGDKVWPQGWVDVSPYAKLYLVGTPREAYHTGADLNFGKPYADLGMPVYSVASGVVIYQASLRPWGNVTIIKHDPLRTPNGVVVYSRYGHMQNVKVRVGERVTRGQQIGEIGDGEKRFIPHLHFDIVNTTAVERSPGDWPGKDLQRLLRNYADPLDFIKQNRPPR
jgi:murein DD-endopeptidase MepM/ murein hydrolase activator NlpD